MTEQVATPAPAAPTPPAQRPADVPEKFWDAAKGTVNTTAMIASYKALEQKLGSTPGAPAAPAADPLKPTGTVAPDGVSIQAPVALTSGSALEAAYTKAVQTGQPLTDADYAALEKSGVSRGVADNYITGQNAVFESTKQKVHSIAGTQQDYANIVAWASTNLPPEEGAAFNDAMKSRNLHTMSLAVTGLVAKYRQSFGSEGKHLTGAVGSPGAGGVQGYASRAEFHKDTGNPQYQKDPTFRTQVQARLKASKF